MARIGSVRTFIASVLIALPALLTAARADIVTDWNVTALSTTALPPNSVLQSRILAIVHAAIYDTVAGIEARTQPYAVDLKAPSGASLDAAIAAATHATLVRLAPLQRPALDASLNAILAKIPDSQGKVDGRAFGAKIAEQMVEIRSSDGAEVNVAFTPKPGPGLYQLTPQLGPAVLAQGGRKPVRTAQH